MQSGGLSRESGKKRNHTAKNRSKQSANAQKDDEENDNGGGGVQSFLNDLRHKKRRKDQEEQTTRRRKSNTATATTTISPSFAVNADESADHPSNQKLPYPKFNISIKTQKQSKTRDGSLRGFSSTPMSLSPPPPANLPPHTFILAPMVGASELPFRILCRRYGADLAYTPMMDATQFCSGGGGIATRNSIAETINTTTTSNDTTIEEPSPNEYLQPFMLLEDKNNSIDHTNTCTTNNTSLDNSTTKRLPDYDCPLVAHVSANTPAALAAAAVQASKLGCAMLDLNLGCPQRTAFLGHFGSYLLDEPQLICTMISTAVAALLKHHHEQEVHQQTEIPQDDTFGNTTKTSPSRTRMPISVKIRLLSSTNVQPTIDFCLALCQAGISLIAIHARVRASWERTSAGARDGPAHLDQVASIQRVIAMQYPHVAIVTNGNTTTFADVQENLQSTQAAGVMSAEGLLDNPALFLPRYGTRQERDKHIPIWSLPHSPQNETNHTRNPSTVEIQKKQQKWQRRLKKIKSIEDRLVQNDTSAQLLLTEAENKLLSLKHRYMRKLQKMSSAPSESSKMILTKVSLGSLYDVADDKLALALEYLDLATVFPVTIRTVVFHIRRMLKDSLTQYQLFGECLQCTEINQVRRIVDKMTECSRNPASFVFDSALAQNEKDALARKKHEEGKRRAYEERMMRKAKREGREDLHFYLNVGAVLPTSTQMAQYHNLPKEEVLALWKDRHSQHCFSHHLDSAGCARDRACAFLHLDRIKHALTGTSCEKISSNENAFSELDECAG